MFRLDCCSPPEGTILSLTSNAVFPLQQVNLPEDRIRKIRVQFMLEREALRSAQCNWFCSNEEFRRRFVRLNLWRGRFPGHSSPRLFYQNPRVMTQAILLSKNIEVLKTEYNRGERNRSSIISACFKLRALLLMAITSREDLVARIASGENVRSVFVEWHSWFVAHEKSLVQRSDLNGWLVPQQDSQNTAGVQSYCTPNMFPLQHRLTNCR